MTKYTAEKVEKARQEVMRLRELLDIAKMRLDEGETFYTRLFTELTPEQRNLPEKEQQREAGILVLDDPSHIKQAAMHLQFTFRELEKEFEALYGIILEN